jgi:hypothetical protein
VPHFSFLINALALDAQSDSVAWQNVADASTDIIVRRNANAAHGQHTSNSVA